MSALEHQVQDLYLSRRVGTSERDAAATRVLAGVADPDVGAIRGDLRDFRQAATASFNALREDFVDLRNDFAGLRDHVDRGFTEMRGRLDAVAAGQQEIVDLLQTLSGREGPETTD